MSIPDPLIAALTPVVDFLRAIDVPFYVGGSVASSFHGAIRSTMDVDIVCRPFPDRIAEMEQQLQSDYYLNIQAIARAMSSAKSFNLIHFATSFKVDVFVTRGRKFDVAAMSRATAQVLGEDGELQVPICSLEDSVLSKLEWYRLGEETSERQWDDVTRLVKLAGSSIDREYLNATASELGVSDLLERLLDKST